VYQATSMISFERFAELSRDGGLVPLWHDVLLDLETPVAVFAKIRRGPFGFLLESAPAGSETWSRYTFLGTEPRRAWRLADGVVHDWTAEHGWHAARTLADPLADLEGLLGEQRPVDVPELGRFWSGAVGYIGYDVVRYIERLPDRDAVRQPLPDALFLFTAVTIIIDNLRSQARLVTGVRVSAGTSPGALRRLYDDAAREIGEVADRMRQPSTLAPLELAIVAPLPAGTSRYERGQFLLDIERIREYIAAGDAFQVLLSRRITVPLDFSTTDLYRAIRTINPSPYMYHLILDGVELVGSSPELQLRVSDGRVTVRPIAGTRPRGPTAEDDARLEAELLSDEKERAEHLMLVDLGRNDVGRVARYGTVEVTELMKVERYSHVLHIVSEVRGELRDGLTALDAFRATFPAGTMTGAPKVRAMEIINELEPERRGAYAGAIGYIASGAQRLDLAITIRTCVVAGGVASVQTGAGIVADSVPEREWAETESKARAMLTAIGRIRAGGNITSRRASVP